MHHDEFDIQDSAFERLEDDAVLRISNSVEKPSPRGNRTPPLRNADTPVRIHLGRHAFRRFRCRQSREKKGDERRFHRDLPPAV